MLDAARRIFECGFAAASLGLIRLRPAVGGLRRDKLGLIGFVFLCRAERNIGVSLLDKRGCGDSVVSEIGFVLRN
ncbi:MAG TPA: hypothetical protein VJJ98_02845 [Sedimentisphaerales bacterium]|nr:hypothetical protein [Sedimentisphaerales bacterium]